MYSGTAVGHRLTRLQPDTEYIVRIAAVSESGQGAWSDDVTFMTTPTPPLAPTGRLISSNYEVMLPYPLAILDDSFPFFLGLVVRQESKDAMKMAWQPGGEFPHFVRYEAQVKSPLGHDFVQVHLELNNHEH